MSSDVPENANAGCPGTGSEGAGKTNSCAGCPNQRVLYMAKKEIIVHVHVFRPVLLERRPSIPTSS